MEISEAEREEACRLVTLLRDKCDVRIRPIDLQNVGCIAFKLQFIFMDEGVVITIRIELKDWQTRSDVVITNMTTFPEPKRSQGFGHKVLGLLLEWARENDLREVRATQVSNGRSEKFWKDNGFVECDKPNSTGDFLFVCPAS